MHFFFWEHTSLLSSEWGRYGAWNYLANASPKSEKWDIKFTLHDTNLISAQVTYFTLWYGGDHTTDMTNRESRKKIIHTRHTKLSLSSIPLLSVLLGLYEDVLPFVEPSILIEQLSILDLGLVDHTPSATHRNRNWKSASCEFIPTLQKYDLVFWYNISVNIPGGGFLLAVCTLPCNSNDIA